MSGQRRKHDKHLQAIVYVGDSGIHGRGLFAGCDIGCDEYIGTFHGPKTRKDGVHVLWVYDSHDSDKAIGREGRNMLRYLNHAEPSNAEFDGFDLYATRAIAKDEEITIDYGCDT